MVVDVIEALTDSLKPRDYWYAMKIHVKSEDEVELSPIWVQLKLESADGKKYLTDCQTRKGFFASFSQFLLRKENLIIKGVSKHLEFELK